MPGMLYVVATPIGNLEDITLRALRVLREVALIAAEDTRRTAKLLSHYGIATRTTSFFAHNEARKTPELIERLRSGDDVALVTDAGTPTVSDPGTRLIAAARADGFTIVPVPGPSAILAALVGCGLDCTVFTFLGFPPRKGQARAAWLNQLNNSLTTVVFFESPHRLRQTLEDLERVLVDRPICLARELTKVHEEFVIYQKIVSDGRLLDPRGEYTVVVGPAELQGSASTEASRVGEMTEKEPSGRRQSLRELATRFGLPVRAVYELLEEAKRLGVIT